LQFCNYLTSGDKSKGAYQFSGNNTNPTSFVSVNRAAAQVVYGVVYVLPTESEWYKAAYFKPDGSGYSIYGNGTDTPPVAGVDTNCDRAVHHPWNVGTGTVEQNGTFDMMGNIQEITETLQQGSYPSVRGGPFDDSLFWIKSSIRNSYMKSSQGTDAGFRIASIPEPTTILLFSLSALFFNRNKK
jgi:formylglycine-generating enzyme required for sulfatase activity